MHLRNLHNNTRSRRRRPTTVRMYVAKQAVEFPQVYTSLHNNTLSLSRRTDHPA